MKATVVNAVAILLAVAATALADPFEVPPEGNAPDWHFPFPYPRNVLWDFATDPLGGPTPNGAPGAHYEGYLDPDLWRSDFVWYNDQVLWLPDGSPYGLPSQWQGLLVVPNIFGQDPVTGEIVFHIDNSSWLNDRKNMWLEFDFIVTDPTGVTIDSAIVAGPQGITFQMQDWMGNPRPLPSGLYRQNAWVGIEPNPLWEELRITLTVGPGNLAVLDSMHVATECLPEPSTFALAGIGLAGLAFWRWRKRR